MAVKSQSEFIVTIGGSFNQLGMTECSGGEISRGVDSYPRAFTAKMGKIMGIIEYGDLTLRAPYDPEEHDSVIELFTQSCPEDLEVVVQPVKNCPDPEIDGRPRVYSCKPVGCTPPEVDRSGEGPSTIEFTFAVFDFKLG